MGRALAGAGERLLLPPAPPAPGACLRRQELRGREPQVGPQTQMLPGELERPLHEARLGAPVQVLRDGGRSSVSRGRRRLFDACLLGTHGCGGGAVGVNARPHPEAALLQEVGDQRAEAEEDPLEQVCEHVSIARPAAVLVQLLQGEPDLPKAHHQAGKVALQVARGPKHGLHGDGVNQGGQSPDRPTPREIGRGLKPIPTGVLVSDFLEADGGTKRQREPAPVLSPCWKRRTGTPSARA